MSLMRKATLYRLATIAWCVVVFAVVVVIVSGTARPVLPPDALPIHGPLQLFGVAVALIVPGVVVIHRLETRAWNAAGERAGLSPRGWGGLVNKPDLVGTIDGREVRARVESRSVGGGGESGSSEARFTVVETDLDEPTDRGFIVTAGAPPTAGLEDGLDDGPGDLADQLTTVGDVAVFGESDAFARSIATSRVQEALTGTDADAAVHVGDSASVILEPIRDDGGTLFGSMVGALEPKIRDRMPGGPETAGMDRKGLVLDGALLQTQVRAVTAVADALEHAAEVEADH